MRRLLTFVAMFTLIGAVLGGVAARAQVATPEEGLAYLPAPLDAYVAAWAAHDPKQIAALYADDAVLQEVVLDGPVLHGPAEIEQWATANFTGFPDLHLEPTAAYVADGHAVLEWVQTGTFTGEIPGLGQGQGQHIAIPGVSVIDLDADNKIIHDNLYYDRATFMSQFSGDNTGSQAEPAATPAS